MTVASGASDDCGAVSSRICSDESVSIDRETVEETEFLNSGGDTVLSIDCPFHGCQWGVASCSRAPCCPLQADPSGLGNAQP